MNHVRLTLDADGREAEIHPMFDVLVNAPYVDRATAMHWNFSGERLGIMHYVEGDPEQFREAVASIPEVVGFEITPAGPRSFYAYVRDATTEPLRALFDIVAESSAVVVPPVEYTPEGTVTYSVFGPGEEIQSAIELIPDPLSVRVEEVTGMAAVPGVVESLLSDRQREAVETALELGYYAVPREATHEEVAEAMDCAPSTAAEHLRKAESKLIASILDE